MSLTVFARDIGQFFNIPSFIILGFILALVAGWTCWRTRSTHLLLARLWRIVYGRNILTDREIGRYLRSQEKLVQFRFYTGIPVKSLPSAKRLISWADDNEEDLASVRRCGEHFDLENQKLKFETLPTTTRQLFRVSVFVVIGWVAAVLFFIALSSDAFFQMKKSKVWFTMTTSEATTVWGSKTITASDCEAKIPNLESRMSITTVELAAICNTFKNPELKKNLQNSVEGQRWATLTLIATLVWVGFFPFFAFTKGAHARDLYKRLKTKGKVTAQA